MIDSHVCPSRRLIITRVAGMSKTQPLLADDPQPTGSRSRVACVNLVATTVGAGVLSIPISFSYTGLLPGLGILCAFAWLSDASLRYISSASALVNARTYAELGERVYGRTGRQLVLWSLLALLVGAVIQVMICVIDLIEMLSVKLVGFDASRNQITATITCLTILSSMPTQLHSLRLLSSVSVLSILFTAACIVGLAALDAGDDEGAPPYAVAKPLSTRWALAMPIHSLAFCSQFNINEAYNELPASERSELGRIVHVAMGISLLIYALVGATGYTLLGARTALFPNILTAFGDSKLVLAGSAAIAVVNLLKLPLVVLPLRSLLLDLCGVPPLDTFGHIAITVVGVSLAGVAAAATKDLAFAFQVSGCTAGVMVCFCLPGMLYSGAKRLERQRSGLLLVAEGGGSTGPTLGSTTSAELCGIGMLVIGATSGIVCLVSLLPL